MAENRDNLPIPSAISSAPGLPINIAVDFCVRVNFAMQQHAVPLVESVTLTNTGGDAIDSITVSISLENEAAAPWHDRRPPGW